MNIVYRCISHIFNTMLLDTLLTQLIHIVSAVRTTSYVCFYTEYL